MLMNRPDRFGAIAILLHWIVVALIITQIVLANLAEAAEESGSPLGQLMWWARHKSFGITILAIAAVRLLWRFVSPPPPWPPMPGWQRYFAQVSHISLYALLFLMPITGWLMSSAANFSVSYFGWFTLPDLIAPNELMKERLESVHEAFATLLVALAFLHALAALKHQFVDRDGLLGSMFGVSRAPR